MRSVTSCDIGYERATFGRRTDRTAVIAFLLAILSGPATVMILILEAPVLGVDPFRDDSPIIWMCMIAMIPEVVAGWISILAIRRIARSEGKFKGRWLAVGAVVISVLAGPLTLIAVAVLIAYLIVTIS